MRSDFVSTVTHDLKTPLALIRLIGETLGRRYSSPETVATYAQLLSTEAAQLTLRIDNLLAYARVAEVPTPHQFATVDLLDVVQESLRRAEPRLRVLGFEVDSDLSEAPSVRGDQAALVQVLDNVIDNAIKYSGASRMLIVHGTVADDMACVTVQDYGIGIPERERTRVFDKFFRGRNAGATGSGLGLAIARRVVLEHGGTIDIETAVDCGTTVRIRIPLDRPA
jgi:signal transduction histidine kinase